MRGPARAGLGALCCPLLSCLLLIGAAGCASSGGHHATPTPTPTTSPGPRTLAPIAEITRRQALDADGRLGADLLASLGPAGKNVVLSPYSIAVALQMALEGARGRTAMQMAATLHQPGVTAGALTAQAAALRTDLAAIDDPRSEVLLRIANGLWPQAGYPIKAPFTQSLQDGFGVGVRPVDFAQDPPGARRTINQAVSDQTNGKIPELFTGDLDPMTRFVLTNAVYLKARWAAPFEAAQTRDATFHAAGHDVRAPFMNQSGALGYARRAGYQLVALPYGRGDLAMTLIVPDGPLAPVQATLRHDGLAAMLSGPLERAEVALSLPKFRFHTQVDLKAPLRGLGMVDAFEPGSADFGGVSGEQLFISKAVHDAYIAVDEQGTEAAAATGIVGQATGAVAPSATVVVDHPFLFAITDQKTGTPLFLGQVADPTAA
jgi:serpin B